MIRICPNPVPWNDVYKHLTRHAKATKCVPPLPPIPLILAGWVFSDDFQKKDRWDETVRWANENGCDELVNMILDSDFYSLVEPTDNNHK